MEQNTVLVERNAGYWVITLNRPQQLNAFNESMHRALDRALTEADDCRALLLTGAGRAFCAGHDLSEPIILDGGATVVDTLYNPLVRKLHALPYPVVAAVNGVAAGAGANIALACDVVFAARSASFIQAFARIGLVPDSGGTWILPRLIGPARARALAFTGAPISAEKAELWGLIWKMVDDRELLSEAHQFCAAVAEGPTIALGMIKRLLDESWNNDLNTQIDLEGTIQREACLTPDHTEGLKAFFEKRRPAFTGRRGV